MTLYRRATTFERRDLGPEGIEEWGIAPSAELYPPTGFVALRSVEAPQSVQFIGTAEQADIEFVPAE